MKQFRALATSTIIYGVISRTLIIVEERCKSFQQLYILTIQRAPTEYITVWLRYENQDGSMLVNALLQLIDCKPSQSQCCICWMFFHSKRQLAMLGITSGRVYPKLKLAKPAETPVRMVRAVYAWSTSTSMLSASGLMISCSTVRPSPGTLRSMTNMRHCRN